MFATDAQRDFEALEALSLPRYDARQLSARAFLDDFEGIQNVFRHERYYALLIPLRDDDRKFSKIGSSSLVEIRDFVLSSVADRLDRYLLKVSEFEDNVYGGSIMSDDGCVVVELATGLQTGVAYGTSVVMSGVLTWSSISMKYSTYNEKERRLIWNAADAIVARTPVSHPQHAIRSMTFLKGYFEFAYTHRIDRTDLRLVFIDVKSAPGFYSIDHIGSGGAPTR